MPTTRLQLWEKYTTEVHILGKTPDPSTLEFNGEDNHVRNSRVANSGATTWQLDPGLRLLTTIDDQEGSDPYYLTLSVDKKHICNRSTRSLHH